MNSGDQDQFLAKMEIDKISYLFSSRESDRLWEPDVKGCPELREDPEEPDPAGDVGEERRHVRTFEEGVRWKVAGKRTRVR